MLEQYIVPLGAINLRKSEENSVKGVDSPQAGKEKAFYAHSLIECFCAVFHKYILQQGFRLSFLLICS